MRAFSPRARASLHGSLWKFGWWSSTILWTLVSDFIKIRASIEEIWPKYVAQAFLSPPESSPQETPLDRDKKNLALVVRNILCQLSAKCSLLFDCIIIIIISPNKNLVKILYWKTSFYTLCCILNFQLSIYRRRNLRIFKLPTRAYTAECTWHAAKNIISGNVVWVLMVFHTAT